MLRSRVIVLEGVDGSGKTTQARLLAEWLSAYGVPVVLTREPGGTTLGEQLRGIVLDAGIACVPRAELLLLLAARAQLVSEVIRPALREGAVVIAARFSPSTLAYQGYGRGLPLDEVRAVDAMARDGLCPDLTLLVDVPLSVSLARIGERTDRFEGAGAAFLQRVIDGYRAEAQHDPTMRVIDGTGTVEAVQGAIRDLVGALASRAPRPSLEEQP